jgi:hypothetical protein
MVGGGSSGGVLGLRVQAEFNDGAGEYRAIVLDGETEEVLAEAPIMVDFRD